MKKIVLLSSLTLLLVACQAPAAPTNETTTSQVTTTQVQAQTVTINIVAEGQAIEGSPFTFEIEEGQSLLGLMKDQMTIEETDGFVSSINGVAQDASQNKWWLFDVNGQASEVGAKEVILKAGDIIDWKLEKF